MSSAGLSPRLSQRPAEQRTQIRDELLHVELSFTHILRQLVLISDSRFLRRDLPHLPDMINGKWPVYVAINIMDIMKIDQIQQLFTVKYRLYLMWELDEEDPHLKAHPKAKEMIRELQEKVQVETEKAIKVVAEEKGGLQNVQADIAFYGLSEEELELLESVYPVPALHMMNGISHEVNGKPGMRVYGGFRNNTAFMWNNSFTVTFRQHFKLEKFPFDSQDLNMEFNFNESRLWLRYCIRLTHVQFFKEAACVPEWRVCTPVIQQPRVGARANTNAIVTIHTQRSSEYYVMNIVPMMSALAFCGSLAYVLPVEHRGGRILVVLTILFVSVAYKLQMDKLLPNVSYDTVLDVLISQSTGCLFLAAALCWVPDVVRERLGDDEANLANEVIGIFNVCVDTLVVVGWIVWALRIDRARSGRKTITTAIMTIDNPTDSVWYAFRYQDLLPVSTSGRTAASDDTRRAALPFSFEQPTPE